MNKNLRRLAAIAGTSALVLSGFALVASAANADQITGTIKLYGQNANVVAPNILGSQITPSAASPASATSSPMFYGISVDQACPTGFQDGASSVLFQDQGAGAIRVGSALGKTITSTVDDPANGYVTGLTAGEAKVSMGQNTDGTSSIVVNNSSLAGAAAASGANPALVTGDFQLRFYCFANRLAPNFTTDKYSVLTLHYNSTAGTWWIPVALQSTSTSLSAIVNANKTVTYTSAVTPSAATGSIVVTTATGTGTGCTITLPATSCTTAAAVADGAYDATATYSGDVTYSGSASTPAFHFIVGAVATAQGQITVNIPATGNTGLTMTGTPSATIGATHVAGNRFTGSADLGAVTITDERQTGAPTWHLAGTLTNLTVGGNTIPATDLGWTPKFAGTPGAANAALAAVVLPAHQTGGTGFNTAKPLAQGDVPTNSAATTTQVYANLSLDTDGNKAAGSYIGQLTLTLTAP